MNSREGQHRVERPRTLTQLLSSVAATRGATPPRGVVRDVDATKLIKSRTFSDWAMPLHNILVLTPSAEASRLVAANLTTSMRGKVDVRSIDEVMNFALIRATSSLRVITVEELMKQELAAQAAKIIRRRRLLRYDGIATIDSEHFADPAYVELMDAMLDRGLGTGNWLCALQRSDAPQALEFLDCLTGATKFRPPVVSR